MIARSLELAGHAIRQLAGADVPLIRQLFDERSDFFRLINGDAAFEAEQIFGDVPPSKHPKDKLVFGISAQRADDRIIGLVELLRGYPTQDDWCIGLLLIVPAHRGRGLGAATIAAVIQFVASAGGRTLQLVVQAQNSAALQFWQRHGFVIRDRVHQQAAHGTNASPIVRSAAFGSC
ncbi:MAG: hypothetical protein JWO36_2724 [Myxococcales bacterium]|nr:hypothetical protein [Myxococcales bacterium]